MSKSHTRLRDARVGIGRGYAGFGVWSTALLELVNSSLCSVGIYSSVLTSRTTRTTPDPTPGPNDPKSRKHGET